jgi:hypothetical protein
MILSFWAYDWACTLWSRVASTRLLLLYVKVAAATLIPSNAIADMSFTVQRLED